MWDPTPNTPGGERTIIYLTPYLCVSFLSLGGNGCGHRGFFAQWSEAGGLGREFPLLYPQESKSSSTEQKRHMDPKGAQAVMHFAAFMGAGMQCPQNCQIQNVKIHSAA